MSAKNEPLTILLVDGDANMRRLLSFSLSHLYKVLEATDGLDALRMIKKFRPCAVLLAMKLPGAMNGLQLLEVIKSNDMPCVILVVMVTACVNPPASQ
jgi:CheY-like chemotaxis protein